ncbi:MAG: hypothetical protein DRH17_12690 [Deltaproteobacteria bacterium]|nr:MAG: hypothetical protein DRH17_12690 [Deltaproteobacteria bacterium]
MVEKNVSGAVKDETGNVVGSISGIYVDDYQDSSSQQIDHRSISITVVDEEGDEIGSGVLEYDDYISYNGGGTRTINIAGSVRDDEGNEIGSASGSLEDQYGSAQAAAPSFAITSYPSGVQAQPGASFTINVVVANNGGAEGTVEVRLKDHNGSVVDSKEVSIAPGSSEQVQLTGTAPSTEGSYTWSVEAYNVSTGQVDDAKTFTLTVTTTPQPSFQITSWPSKITTSPGAGFTVSVTVANNGSDGDAEIRVKDHNGSIVARATVTIAGGSSQSVSLAATAPSTSGTYTWRVEVYNVDAGRVDDSKDFTVEVVGAVPIPMDTFWYLLIAVVLIAMLLLLIALALRRS